MITIGENRKTPYCSLIADLEEGKLYRNYPMELMGSYVDIVADPYNVTYSASCPRPTAALESDLTEMVLDAPSEAESQGESLFCCEKIQPFKHKPTSRDASFQAFCSGKGTDNHVFSVRKQVDNGPLIWTKLFKLSNGKRVLHTGACGQQVAFKNYRCPACKFFYSIDLCPSKESSFDHHRRLVPFEHWNEELFDQFMALQLQ
jgi:hypothetical protein